MYGGRLLTGCGGRVGGGGCEGVTVVRGGRGHVILYHRQGNLKQVRGRVKFKYAEDKHIILVLQVFSQIYAYYMQQSFLFYLFIAITIMSLGYSVFVFTLKKVTG